MLIILRTFPFVALGHNGQFYILGWGETHFAPEPLYKNGRRWAALMEIAVLGGLLRKWNKLNQKVTFHSKNHWGKQHWRSGGEAWKSPSQNINTGFLSCRHSPQPGCPGSFSAGVCDHPAGLRLVPLFPEVNWHC